MKNFVFKLIALMFLTGICDLKSQMIMTERQFTEKFMELFEQAFPQASVQLKDVLSIELKIPGYETITVYLHNAYLSYKMNEEDIESIFKQYSAWLKEFNEKDAKRITPVIKSRDFIQEVESLQGNNRVYSEKLNEELLVCYVFDRENSMMYLSERDFMALELSTEALRQRALENLSKIIPEIRIHDYDGYYMVEADGNYESSLILVNSIWNTKNFPVEGHIVVAIPSRDLLIVTGSLQMDAIKEIQEKFLSEIESYPYFISNKFFIYKNKQWHVFRPE